MLIACAASAAPPDLKHLLPAAAQQGTNSLVSIGKTDTWPNLWTDATGVKFTPTPMLGTYNVEVSKDAPPGAHLVRAWDSEGASAPRFFIVSAEPEIRAIEPNDTLAQAQPIAALPATVSGRLEKNGDVDAFAVSLKKGETLVAWVQSHVLASSLDPLIRVVDINGRVAGFNHDSRTIDPLLAWEAPRDGSYVVQVMGFAYPAQSNVQLAGGEGCIYRLHLTNGPTVRYAAPLRLQAGTKSTLHLVGWNLQGSQAEFDATQLAAGSTIDTPLGPGTKWLEPLRITDSPEQLELENRDAGAVQALEVPAAVTGRIRAAREEDRYTFTAVKGRAYEIEITAAKAGSPLDPWLRLESADGKEVAKNDDSGSRDPRLTWSAPADGTFTIVLGDVTHRGGDEFLYRLAVREGVAEVTATIAAHSATVAAGASTELKVGVKRTHGFKAKLELQAKDLPEGVAAPAVEVPEKDGEVTIKLTADAAAKTASRPFQLVLREMEGNREHPVRHLLVSVSENNGVPQGYAELVVEGTEDLWLTVTEAKPPK